MATCCPKAVTSIEDVYTTFWVASFIAISTLPTGVVNSTYRTFPSKVAEIGSSGFTERVPA